MLDACHTGSVWLRPFETLKGPEDFQLRHKASNKAMELVHDYFPLNVVCHS